MLNFEGALKTIGDWISKETESRKYPKGELLGLSESLQVLKSAIARQSVKSEDVAEAIEWVEETLSASNIWRDGDFGIPVKQSIKLKGIRQTAITALQAYEPWVSVEVEKPESGKHVLLCCEVKPSGKRYVCDGYYAKSKSITSGYSSEWDCEYDEETDEYYLPEGYYEIIKNWDDYSSIVIEDFVTHWKPLPEPPKGE